MDLKLENELWAYLFRRKVDPQSTLHQTLIRIPLFHKLSPRELEGVSRKLHVRHYRPEELVFREEEAGCGMYIIEKGSVRITGYNHSNQEVEYAVLREGEFFGELALVNSAPRKASATCMEKATLLGFFEPDLRELIEKNPSMGCKILLELSKVLSHRLEAMNNKVKLLQAEAARDKNVVQ